MLDWHRVSIDDKALIQEKLQGEPRQGCEYGFCNIFSYGAKYPLFVAQTAGCFVTKCEVGNYDAYCFPVGGDKTAAVKAVVAEARERGRACEIYGMTEADAAILEAAFPGEFQIAKERDSFDYVYSRDDLVSLAGRKYQSKRNHISFFERNFRWSYERITPDNIPACLAMSRQWLEESHPDRRAELEDEYRIIEAAFANYEALGCLGGLLRVDGGVAAFCFGEALTDDMFCVHFEKAFASVRGAYPMINRMFAQEELSAFRYVNREDDLGSENLRKAKLSYHPAFFVEKYETRIL